MNNVQGRYVRVQLSGSNYLNFAELQVIGTAGNILDTFRTCVGAGGVDATCTLPVGTYAISQAQPILIARSNITVIGGGSNRSQTVLLRDPAYTDPLIRVDASQPLTGITIQNLTFCGSGTLPNPNPSPACPARVQTTCGIWTGEATNGQTPGGALCTDLEVDNANTGLNPANPFSNAGPYSVTIANCDFEDAAGHAISLYPNVPKKVNDVYLHDSTINSSAVTGILSGVGGAYYDRKFCDADANFSNDTGVYLPRNIRLEANIFQNNNTGAIGMTALWVGLRNNTFGNNYINPQAGNTAGGTVFFDQCTDQVQIRNNTLIGPDILTTTSGLELWGRNIDVESNYITNYPGEGISLNSVYNATIQNNNQTLNNGRLAPTGGILVWTSGPGAPCDQIPRDTQTVTISGNTSTGQADGVRLGDRGPDSTNIIDSLTITNDNALNPNSEAAVLLTPIVTWNGYVAPPLTPGTPKTLIGALPVNPIAPVTSKCSMPGSEREIFAFSAIDVNGARNIFWLQGTFSITGNDPDGSGGPDAGAQGCHFIYYAAPYSVLYLDGPSGGSNWIGSSLIGPGGTDLSNGYCTIHAGSPSSQVQIEPKILNLTLDVEFPFSSSTSSHKHMYVVTVDNNGQLSTGGAWKYWGWWATP